MAIVVIIIPLLFIHNYILKIETILMVGIQLLYICSLGECDIVLYIIVTQHER